jgi:hypothetical protein
VESALWISQGKLNAPDFKLRTLGSLLKANRGCHLAIRTGHPNEGVFWLVLFHIKVPTG